MRVFVIGSSHYKEADAPLLFTFAAEIGAELAHRNHTVLVGSVDESTVDYHVVKGMIDSGADKNTVEIHRPANHQGADDEAKLTNAANVRFVTPFHASLDWHIVHTEAITTADAVLLLGGRPSTASAGVTAKLLGKAVIPVACFGGGAREVWTYSSSRREEFYSGALNDEQIDCLASSTPLLTAQQVVSDLESVYKARSRSSTPTWLLGVVIVLMSIAIAGIFIILFRTEYSTDRRPAWQLLSMFLGAFFGGFLGTTMRSLWRWRDGEKLTEARVVVDAMLGIAAGVVSAVLYLVTKVVVVGAPTYHDNPTRVTLMMMLLGIFAAFYLETAFKRFDSLQNTLLAAKAEQK